MSALQKLASVGLTDSPEDVAKFYDMFATPEDYDNYMASNKMAMGGITNEIAFPQQPLASFAKGGIPTDYQFFAGNQMPWNGPIGFYADGGMFMGATADCPNPPCPPPAGHVESLNLIGKPNTSVYQSKGFVNAMPDLTLLGYQMDPDGVMRKHESYDEDEADLDRRSYTKPPSTSTTRHPRKGGSSFFNWGRGGGGKKRKHCTVDGCYYFDEGGFTDGIAYPQQPTDYINFSAFPWQPKYGMGGGLPGGPNEGAPCMECGGSMEHGGYMDDQYGGMVDDQMTYFKEGGNWIQKATASIKRRGTEGKCTGSKFGGPGCPPGSKAYNLAKTFRKMAKGKKAYGGVTGTGMDDTDSYIQQMNQNFIDRVTPEQPEQMSPEGMPMAYNGYNMPQMANMNMYGYNPMPGYMGNQQTINSPQQWDQNAMLNNRNLEAQNKKLRAAGLGALGAAWSGTMPFVDPNRKYVEHKFSEFKPDSQARYGQELTQYDGTGPSEVPKWDPNDPSKYFDWYFNKRQSSGSTAPKWDPNDPSGYLDWYLNNKRSANNQTKYDYGDWGSWNNVQNTGTGNYTYNTPYGSGAGMAMPAQKYMQDMMSDKDYYVGPGTVEESYKGLFKRRPSGRKVTFNVYRRTPAGTGQDSKSPGGDNMNIKKKQSFYDPNSPNDDMDQQKHGGIHRLYKAAGGFNTPNGIDNMVNPLSPENPENRAGQITYEEQIKRDLSGADLAGGLMAPIAFGNYLSTQNQMQNNKRAMGMTADELVNPMQAGLVGSDGNIGWTGQATGVPFGGTRTTYGMQKGYFQQGGETYQQGDVLDLTDAEIKRLKDLGYQIEDYTEDDYA